MIITTHAFARAGLVGNPSDGYFGKTISFIIRNFRATVRLWESPHFEILPTHGDLGRFDSVAEFLQDVKLNGYYGGMRLIKAAVKRFHDACRERNIQLHRQNFTISFETDIPRLVGLAGSSAIITATMRALLRFYPDVKIPDEILPTLILSAEKDELGINAGLQDRVIQAYEGIVFMDFDRALMQSRGCGRYERLTPPKLPPLYVAYDTAAGGHQRHVALRNIRELFDRGDPTVLAAIQKFRDLTDEAKSALMSGDWKALGRVMNDNFDVRRSIIDISPENLRMIEAARSTGASAKFCGSGGAICGLYEDGRQYQKLVDKLAELRCTVLRPLIFES